MPRHLSCVIQDPNLSIQNLQLEERSDEATSTWEPSVSHGVSPVRPPSDLSNGDRQHRQATTTNNFFNLCLSSAGSNIWNRNRNPERRDQVFRNHRGVALLRGDYEARSHVRFRQAK